MEELNKLRDYNIPPSKQYLERMRDVQLFCYFSGLRHSNVHRAILEKYKDDSVRKRYGAARHQKPEDERIYKGVGRTCRDKRTCPGDLIIKVTAVLTRYDLLIQ